MLPCDLFIRICGKKTRTSRSQISLLCSTFCLPNWMQDESLPNSPDFDFLYLSKTSSAKACSLAHINRIHLNNLGKFIISEQNEKIGTYQSLFHKTLYNNMGRPAFDLLHVWIYNLFASKCHPFHRPAIYLKYRHESIHTPHLWTNKYRFSTNIYIRVF